jgi:hypothetical protein
VVIDDALPVDIGRAEQSKTKQRSEMQESQIYITYALVV